MKRINYKGLVIQTTGRNHIVKYENRYINCSLKGKLRIKGIRSTNPLAVGDIVDFQLQDESEGVIFRINPRKNCILRKSSNLSKETHVIAANIDSLMVFFTLRDPITTLVFLDRILVAAESYSIPTIIIFNKSDQYSDEEIIEIENLRRLYEDIGYKTFICSVKEKYNIDLIRDNVTGKINMITGHSGVGKSSFINSLNPMLNLKTGEISAYHKSGKHITTFARMHEINEDTFIIDTPGIRGFGLVDIKKEEISHFFPEIFKISNECKYYNCTHIHEPDCAVLNAVNKNVISISRYKSYLNMVLDENDKHRQKDLGLF